jgi:hypothetical protein
MRSLGTCLLAVPLNRRLAKVCTRVDTRRVDVIILGEVAHDSARCLPSVETVRSLSTTIAAV